ncbi:MAG: class I SAM-dependent methyltransferase [Alistipes sp.]|nr:class I SAM-dependent methyltransferase [Alistipes sp.]
MAQLHTAERVSRNDASDNYVFQRSILAYHHAAGLVSGDVLEVGTGMGYGIEVIAPSAKQYTTIDKSKAYDASLPENVKFHQMEVPPIEFEDESFDYVISFQVIEHIKRDKDFIKEVSRILRKGGKFIVSTPNAPMSLTRNPWHIREYNATEFRDLLSNDFSHIDTYGVNGNDKVMQYYEQNRKSVERIMRFDVLDLQHRLPRQILQIPYDIMNRLNRRLLLKNNNELTCSIAMSDYSIGAITEHSFDLYFIATK